VVGKRLYRASSEQGGDDVVGEYPLCLTFRASKGDVVGFRASEGGDVVGEYPLRLAF
jgi:hypothetical protein